MISSKLLKFVFTFFTIFALSACAPLFRGGPVGPAGGGMKLTENQLIINTDLNEIGKLVKEAS